MTSRNGCRNGHAIDVVEQRDVEDYAFGRLRNSDLACQVEEAMLEDEAARDVVRDRLRGSGDGNLNVRSPGILHEALQDLHTCAHSCTELGEMYENLARHTGHAPVARFLDGRRAAFHRAADRLNRPLQDRQFKVPDARPEETVLLARESRESLIRMLCANPAGAMPALDELHAVLMRDLRTLVHLPWPLEMKLLIAETYASLREELESGAWKMKRRPRI